MKADEGRLELSFIQLLAAKPFDLFPTAGISEGADRLPVVDIYCRHRDVILYLKARYWEIIAEYSPAARCHSVLEKHCNSRFSRAVRLGLPRAVVQVVLFELQTQVELGPLQGLQRRMQLRRYANYSSCIQ